MQPHLPQGIRVEEGTTQQQAINGVETRATAFIGACLTGPTDSPTLVSSFNQFENSFGPLSDDSPLSHAVKLYFLNGGRTAWIVRVANQAKPGGIVIATSDQPLRLWSLFAGTHDYLRAAVDYDGIDISQPDCFNLTVQRLEQPNTERVIDQEIFREVSILKTHPRFIGSVVATSALVRVDEQVPETRPLATLNHGSGHAEYFDEITLPGCDGTRITMRDILGSSCNESGLFSLTQQYDFGQLYIPPVTLDIDVSVPVLRAAARLCARRNALLIVDAPRDWSSVTKVENSIERYSLRGDNVAMYYPWVELDSAEHYEPLTLPAGGAVAGALDRCMEQSGPSGVPAGQKMVLRGIRRFVTPINDAQSYRLTLKGVNSLRQSRGGRKVIWDAILLTREGHKRNAGTSLKTLRVLHYIAKSVESGLQWVAFEPSCDSLWFKVQNQVQSFMQECKNRQLLPNVGPGQAFTVRCDLSTNPTQLRGQCQLAVQIDVALAQPSQFVRLKIQVATAEARLYG